jgi:hypothetical protein
VDLWLASLFRSSVLVWVQGLVTAQPWWISALLAGGWALAFRQHTLTTSPWLPGATTLKQFSRCYVLLGEPFSRAGWRVWTCIIRPAA